MSSSQALTFCVVPTPVLAGNQLVSSESRPVMLKALAATLPARQMVSVASSQPLVKSSSSLLA